VFSHRAERAPTHHHRYAAGEGVIHGVEQSQPPLEQLRLLCLVEYLGVAVIDDDN
jgi:hypothetical protein